MSVLGSKCKVISIHTPHKCAVTTEAGTILEAAVSMVTCEHTCIHNMGTQVSGGNTEHVIIQYVTLFVEKKKNG